MKKLIIFFVLLSIVFATGCTAVVDINDETPSPDTGYAKSDLNRELSPSVTPEQIRSLAESNTAFALSFYDNIRQKEGNLIFSPISLSLALSMTLAGAESATENAMIEALKLSLPENEIYPTFNALLLAIEDSQKGNMPESEGSVFQLNIANSLWGQVDYAFKQDFLDVLAINFGAGMHQVDYIAKPEEARNAINKWIEQETQDKIKDLIPPGAIDTLTRLVLANAIYFNGSWLHPFDENGTQKAPFYTLDGSELAVDMMKLYGERLGYMQGEDFQVVDLPYLSNDFSMTIILPEQGAFKDVEGELSLENIISIFDNLGYQRVNLELPKFDFETTVNAKDPLASMGMAEAFFPESANFSGITDSERLYITEVLHKATITVDETGTEAAAATAVIVGTTSMDPNQPISLVVDRPFLYFIQHKPTGSVLFMGRVTEP